MKTDCNRDFVSVSDMAFLTIRVTKTMGQIA